MARYIDADKALLELQKFSLDTSNSYGCGYSDCLTAVEDVLNEAPTADVEEVKEARWKGAGFGEYYCSLCNRGIRQYEGQPYCSECGALMDGGEAE